MTLINKLWIKILQPVASIIYPPTCALCKAPSSQALDLCAGCYADLPYNLTPCSRCAVPLPPNYTLKICIACLRDPLPFDKCIIPLKYTDTVPYLITGLKFRGHLVYGQILSELLAVHVLNAWNISDPTTRPQCIIPVPLHTTRLRERGFNQAHQLAITVAKKLAITLDVNSCIRVLDTPHQTGLTRKERQHNLSEAFAVTPSLPSCVAIVDDVVTTGATAAELARTLKQAGVRRVEVWAVAKTEHGRHRLSQR